MANDLEPPATAVFAEPPVPHEERLERWLAASADRNLGKAERDRRTGVDRVTVYQDRDRIARELNDVVIRRLFASGLHLQSLAGLLTDAGAVARLDAVVEELDTTIREIRSAVYSLRNPAS